MKQAPFHASPTFTPQFVADALGIPLPPIPAKQKGNGLEPFTFVTSDSRKVQPGCVFVALPGEKFDGHTFIQTAISQGARAVVCRRGYPTTPSASALYFMVDDTLAAYRRLAAAWRREFSVPVIAVAGSVGKTTTKEILAALLRGRWKNVLKTEGSQNGFVGIPMTLLELRPEHGAAVIEVGIDEIGAMAQHMEIVGATVSVLTAIGPEHLEKLQDIPTVAREEGIALTAVAQAGGSVVINLDDPWIRPFSLTLRTLKKQVFSLPVDLPAEAIARLPKEAVIGTANRDATEVEILGGGMTGERFTLPLPGLHNARNFLAAVAVARHLGLSTQEIRKGLATFQGAEGRSQIRELPGKTFVLCDYYNASPASMAAGLELLTQVAGRATPPAPRWACLADMLELGPDEERFHRELADKLVALGIEHVLLFGPRMAALADELGNRGFKGEAIHFPGQRELAAHLLSGIAPGDAILIKGSRGMKMEEIWKIIDKTAQSYAKAETQALAEAAKHAPGGAGEELK
ncbi:MAG: UDP-N-acetylmuramoyl-tripeptide--D-alanyl-D-alanine ligase [Oligoflexia bacterium]|nr:UDP-N-acetylmuramoyl-tripeptide--D-alanyl-D-alanine ligase [Oligoflexia bacterium]